MEAIFITREARVPRNCIDKLKELGVTVYENRGTTDEIARQIANAEIVAAFYNNDLDKVIYDAPKLKYFINTAVGYERIDLNRMRARGVSVINCPTYNNEAVAEHAIGLMFAVARRIVESNQSIRNGEWLDEDFVGTEIAGQNIGFIGHGNIALRIEKIVRGLTDQVRFTDSKSAPEQIDELIEWTDVLFVCAVLNDRTRHMIDARRLALLKPGTIIVNISRGAIIDQQALFEKLKLGDILAGLDVYENEPSSNRVNGLILELVKLPNVVATPHTAYNTKESGEKLGQEIIANIQACLKKEPINVVGEE